MRPYAGPIRALAAALFLLACACSGEGGDGARLHRAQRDYYRARQFHLRLDIYPDRSIAEQSLRRYLDIVADYPPIDLPDSLSAPEREGTRVRIARVGAMSALAAAGIERELGDRQGAIALLTRSLRPDLPLGALVERRLRGTLSSHLVEEGDPAAGLEALHTLLRPIAPNLKEGHAAYPDEELLALPRQTLDIAAANPVLLAVAEAEADSFFEAVIDYYSGGDAEYEALLGIVDLALATERWKRGEDALRRLAEHFPGRDPWRSDLRRARLLIEVLGREADGEEILRGLSLGKGEAAARAGVALSRHLIGAGRLEEAEAELRRLQTRVGRGGLRGELLYLWGELELRRDSWERAGDRWREAAGGQPFSAFGLRARLGIAMQWATLGEASFSGRALARLFTACRRNTRHDPGSARAGLSLELESRGDSLLGTLPASVSIVRQLQEQRASRREGP